MKQNKTQKVMKYMAKHPNAKASEIAKATGVGVSYVYVIISKTKKESKPPRKIILRSAEVNLAHKLGLTTEQYARSKAGLPPKKDNINHPEHYKTGGIETIDFIEAKNLGYHLGNVIKYITRADYKGNRLEDLKKAQWYLNRAVANLEK
jgi:hypothetical protein